MDWTKTSAFWKETIDFWELSHVFPMLEPFIQGQLGMGILVSSCDPDLGQFS